VLEVVGELLTVYHVPTAVAALHENARTVGGQVGVHITELPSPQTARALQMTVYLYRQGEMESII